MKVSTESNSKYIVELRGISKRFGNVQVLRNINLQVEHGEILALLGPSGCGKSTTLNIVAGFFFPDEGQVFLEGQNVDRLPTHKRNLGMVFQTYSLFPHYTVFDNVAFGLSIRKMKPAEIRNRVMWALSMVRLPDIADRFPAQLSGGQKQRVALARALVLEPKVLLLDEPLSNLDARLREELRIEFKRIHEDAGVTMIYVTHDQEEAVILADRIALMQGGNIEQLGNAVEVFESPQTKFAAHFMGFSNFIPGEVLSQQAYGMHIKLGGEYVIIINTQQEHAVRQQVIAAIRDDRVVIEDIVACEGEVTTELINKQRNSLNDENRLMGKIEESVYTGNSYLVFVNCGSDIHLQIRAPTQRFLSSPLLPGMIVRIHLPKEALRVVNNG